MTEYEIEQDRRDLDPFEGPTALINLLAVTFLLGIFVGALLERLAGA